MIDCSRAEYKKSPTRSISGQEMIIQFKVSGIRLERVEGRDALKVLMVDKLEKLCLALGVAKISQCLDVLVRESHKFRISLVSSGSRMAARKRSASFPGA